MSEKINQYLPSGIAMLIIFGLVMGTYYILEVKNQSVENSNQIDKLNATINNFIDQWQKRVSISNNVNNSTQGKIINLTTDLRHTEDNILGNLTRHRIVANDTRDQVNNIIKQLNTTQHQSVANLTAQHDDILEILKKMTNSTSD